MRKGSNRPRKTNSFNRSAIFKTIAIVAILGFAASIQFPLATIGGMWIDDAQYHLSNNTTWLGMTSKQKLAWCVIPPTILIPPLSIFYALYRSQRKRLLVNSEEEGTVTFVHGVTVGNSNIYDMACILYNRYHHMAWKEVPQPLSGDFYKGKIVIYYKTNFFTLPWRWKRICLTDSKDIKVGLYSLWVRGKYQRLVKHPFDSLLHYQEYYNNIKYKTEGLDIETFEAHHKRTIMRIQDDDINLLQANPSISGPMVKDSLFIVSAEQKQRDIDMMPAEVRERYLEEAYAPEEDD